ncbi:MAG TPA: SRPBCC family protein [Solirubrobacteraceae bacterium]|nr:SRPBCC family protein [Solirubrobacteraceae bacterium]
MATVRRSRSLAATPQELWAIVGDAHHLPRWWPRVTRVESVDDEGFTQVLQPPKGKPVRADFRVVCSQPPSVRRWAQELAGTPFERILSAAETEVRLEPEGETATTVAISLTQRPRGLALLGGFMVRAAARRQVDEALEALEALVTASSASAPGAPSASPSPGARSGRWPGARAG